MDGVVWNLWHGCHKKSEGCQHCYVYRRDAEFDKNPDEVRRTSLFNLPVRRTRQGEWKIPPGTLMWTCFTSDFFIEEADEWRDEAWQMMRLRCDLSFFIVTKRPERILQSLPDDWGDGYENVTICCTMENQRRVDERLPLFRSLSIGNLRAVARASRFPWRTCWLVRTGNRRRRVGQRCAHVRLRLGSRHPSPMRGIGRFVLLQADWRTFSQRWQNLQHSATFADEAGKEIGHKF